MNKEGTQVDQVYLDHTNDDIWRQEGDAEITAVRLMVNAGRCYWKETAAPAGYKLITEKNHGDIYHYDHYK